MKRVLAGIVALLAMVSFVSCGSNETTSEATKSTSTVTSTGNKDSSDNEVDDEQEDYENVNDLDEKTSSSEILKNVIYDTFNEIEYLEDDKIFKLTTESGTSYAVDRNGKASYLEDIILKSKIINRKNDSVFDIYGIDITDRFISEPEIESIINICNTDDGYVVAVLKEEETPTSSRSTVIAYDYDGKVIFSFDSEEYSFISEEYYLSYLGDNVFGYRKSGGAAMYNIHCINAETDEHFNFTIQAGDTFSNGLIINQNNHSIIDTHGNTLFDDNDELDGDIYGVGEGMFINFYDSKFYNMADLSLAADLSEYTFVAAATGFGNIDWAKTQDGAFEFIDGYCGIRMKNDNKAYFYGIIDKSGNWVREPERVDSFLSGSYNGKLTDNLLDIGGIFNISTGELLKNPVNTKSYTRSVVIDGTAYFIDDNGYFCSYDYDNQDYNTIEVYLE